MDFRAQIHSVLARFIGEQASCSATVCILGGTSRAAEFPRMLFNWLPHCCGNALQFIVRVFREPRQVASLLTGLSFNSSGSLRTALLLPRVATMLFTRMRGSHVVAMLLDTI